MFEFLSVHWFSILTVIGYVGLFAYTILIKFNDMKHMMTDIKSLREDFRAHQAKVWERIDEHAEKYEQLGREISKLEGIIMKNNGVRNS